MTYIQTYTYSWTAPYHETMPYQQNNDKIEKVDEREDIKMLEARIAKMESDIEYLKRDVGEIKTDIKDIKNDNKTDFRIMFGSLITVALGLAWIMAKGFNWF